MIKRLKTMTGIIVIGFIWIAFKTYETGMWKDINIHMTVKKDNRYESVIVR